MLIDTHTHLDFPKFDDDREEVIVRAKENGIEKIINITSYRKDFDKVKKIAEGHDNIWQSVGIHPHDTLVLKNDDWLDDVRKYAAGKKVVAIGEIGLDYFELPSYVEASEGRQNTKEEQKLLFTPQLELAQELNLAVVLHIRDAYDDVYELIQGRGLKAVVHCFSGDVRQAQMFLDKGFLLSFTGIITYPKTEKLAEVVQKVPLERIMVETDAPFLAPQRVRGERCEPAFAKDVAAKIAEIKGISFDEVAEKTSKNAEEFFKI
ncbi:TatD family hydrolase [Patescibacteria group bacterium]